MFEKAKAIHKAKKMQSEMKKQIEKIFHQEEKKENTVLIRGDKNIEEIIIDGEERKDIKDLINNAAKKVDKKVEKQMKDQAGGLMEMLGL